MDINYREQKNDLERELRTVSAKNKYRFTGILTIDYYICMVRDYISSNKEAYRILLLGACILIVLSFFSL